MQSDEQLLWVSPLSHIPSPHTVDGGEGGDGDVVVKQVPPEHPFWHEIKLLWI